MRVTRVITVYCSLQASISIDCIPCRGVMFHTIFAATCVTHVTCWIMLILCFVDLPVCAGLVTGVSSSVGIDHAPGPTCCCQTYVFCQNKSNGHENYGLLTLVMFSWKTNLNARHARNLLRTCNCYLYCCWLLPLAIVMKCHETSQTIIAAFSNVYSPFFGCHSSPSRVADWVRDSEVTWGTSGGAFKSWLNNDTNKECACGCVYMHVFIILLHRWINVAYGKKQHMNMCVCTTYASYYDTLTNLLIGTGAKGCPDATVL